MSEIVASSPRPSVRASGAVAPRNSYVSSYTDLSREIKAAGLLRRRYGFYWTRIVLTVAAFFAIWVAVPFVHDSWWQLALAAALATVSTQFGYLGHDGAHQQMFHSPQWNRWVARVLSCGFTGLSYSWWMGKHTKHHQAPNQIATDPDIVGGPIAFTPATAAARTGWQAAFTRRQGWLFFPLLMFEGVALHVASITMLVTARGQRHRFTELGAIVLRIAVGIVLPLVFMPLGIAAAFIGVQLALFGLMLGGTFATNHKGMPLVPKSMRVDFLRRQVLMSRNVVGGPFLCFAMGGLNYQIEHHLFPSMPRPNLRMAQPLVKAHCAQQQVHYTEKTLTESYGIVVRYLNQVGIGSRDPFECPLVREYHA
ncbi:fatty acid desaturase [Antricoccus suffuscus]|uniref:Fatty acid desaturase n=1 Tax=Antricoccus suffuscus TaxID=1629062 RepID=A0A2T0Z9B8_9ACTN|nr:acyl-CoA desaturase [Antricoccus suffuscus]PRZ32748.1 fatty acid desaturase [Antricoccus suffuscus]